ncbi:MAG: hypothetical protein QOF78_4536 [Phycisphaerales bacterium]|jgi:hypothetical protein|nr:hypothetical protein [Phycisphaerales bacterium]
MKLSGSFALCVALAVAAAGVAGCGHTIQVYDGDKLADAQVAHVFNTGEVRLVRVDERPIEDFVWSFRGENAPEKHRFDLLPGEHRIAVKYYRTIADSPYGREWQESVNNVTMRHAFEAGKSYSFLVQTVTGPSDRRPRPNEPVPAGVWRPFLIEKSSGEIVAQPEGDLAAGAPAPARAPQTSPPVAPQPYAPPQSGQASLAPAASPAPASPDGLVSGVATISGVAQVQTKKLGLVTAAGREVLLVPRSPRVAKWIEEEIKFRRPGPKLPFPPNTPDEAEDDDKVRKAIGYGDGQFMFERVPLGEYLVVFEGDEKEVFAVAEVSVHPGDTRIDGVTLAPPTAAAKRK